MNIHDKIKRLKKTKRGDIFKIAGTEKTGVVNSLVMLGSVATFITAVEHEVNAINLHCDDTGEITETDLSAIDSQIDDSQWKNHCWNWSWCWGWGWGHSAG